MSGPPSPPLSPPTLPPHLLTSLSPALPSPARARGQGRLRIALVLVVLILTSACGGQTGGTLATGRLNTEGSPTERYAASLRLAALGRVELRAGADEMAAEHFKAAYRKHPHPDYLLAAARAAEKAKLYAEAHDALRRAQDHDLAADERSRVAAELVRLEPLVPPGLVRVTVQVQPEGARVELTRQMPGEPAKGAGAAARSFDRVVLGTGGVFLQAGTWAVYSTARGYQSELQTVQVAPDGGEFVAVALGLEDTGPQLAEPVKSRIKKPDGVGVPEDKKVPEPDGPVVEFGMTTKPKRSSIHTWGPLVSSALGVVAVGAGGWFGFQATQNGADANDLQAQGLSKAAYDSDFAFYRQQTESNAQLANYAFIGGGALVAIGSLWWMLAPSADAAADEGPKPKMTDAGSASRSLIAQGRSGWRPPTLVVLPTGAGLSWTF